MRLSGIWNIPSCLGTRCFLLGNNYQLKQVAKSMLTIACRERGYANQGKQHSQRSRWKKKRDKCHDEDRISGGSDLFLLQTLWYVLFYSYDTYHRLSCHQSFMFLSLFKTVNNSQRGQRYDRMEIAKDLQPNSYVQILAHSSM